MNNKTFANWLAITNQEQVLMARFARDKAVRTDVRAFAANIEKAHQSRLEELKEIASADLTDSIVLTDRINANAGQGSVGNNASNVSILRLHLEMSEQCLKDCKATLSTKEGHEFDKCFVEMQIAKHAVMHSSLTVFARYATGGLRELIKKSLANNAQHMQLAVSLLE